VDPIQATREILFEPDALDAAVAPLGASGPRLRLNNVQVLDDGLRLQFNGEAEINCQWPRLQCTAAQQALPPADALPSPGGDAWLQV
ncbi:S9 family peptidase, partial [Klebsiella pneumoniae]|nr:S9 family peptidase [Klebsiella pneumoniae]